MKYKNYSTVNIKVIDGVTYTAYRHNTNPEDEFIVSKDKKGKEKKVKEKIKNNWLKVNKLKYGMDIS